MAVLLGKACPFDALFHDPYFANVANSLRASFCFKKLMRSAFSPMHVVAAECQMMMLSDCWLAGHTCWGILNGPATGEALAQLIVEGKPKYVDLKAFDPARFGGRRFALR